MERPVNFRGLNICVSLFRLCLSCVYGREDGAFNEASGIGKIRRGSESESVCDCVYTAGEDGYFSLVESLVLFCFGFGFGFG